MSVTVVVLDRTYELDQFDVKNIPDTLYKWELGGITDPIGQLISWLWEQISDGLDTVKNAVINWVTTVRDAILGAIDNAVSTLSDAINAVSTAFNDFAAQITSAFDSLSEFVSGAISTIQTAISDLSTQLAAIATAVTATLTDISLTVGKIIDELYGVASKVYNYITAFASTIGAKITEFGQRIITYIQNIPDAVKGVVNTLAKYVVTGITQLSNAIASLGATVWRYLTEFGADLWNRVKGLIDWFSGKIAGIIKTIEDGFNALKKAVAEIGVTFQGFVNPLAGIKQWLETKLAGFFEGLVNGIKALAGFFTPEGFAQFANALRQKLGEIGAAIWTGLVNFGNTIWNALKGAVAWIRGIAGAVYNELYAMYIGALKMGIEAPLAALSARIKELPQITGEFDALSYLAMGYSVEAAKQMAALSVAEAVGDALGDQEVSVEPMGLGAKIRLKLGKLLKAIPKALKETLKHIALATSIGYAFWVLEPTKYYVRKVLRNTLPVELPTMHEIIEMTQRAMPTDKFGKYLSTLKDVLAFRGFADWVIETVTLTPDQYAIKVKDRFGKERTIPLAMLYEIPTGSELCRMMIHDIFGSFDDFKKIMQSRGFIPDVAKMYYLLHYKYPSLDKLWEFACRATAGMAWVSVKPVTIEDIGYPNAKAPKELNVANVTPENVGNVLNQFVQNYLMQYAKWHDYAPFAWIPNFTADGLIALDLMADIPQRIDARWMYKWGIIDDTQLFRIVVARGMHPDWVKKITQAEAMNALAEERTYARTGIIDLVKYGFMKKDTADKILANLTEVTILGEKLTVKFLEGERKLLLLRAEYDRYYKLLETLEKNVILAYVWNVVDSNTAVQIIKQTAQQLKIPFEIDESFIQAYISTYSVKHQAETIERIRRWMRTFVWRATQLAEAGYDPSELIDEYAKKAKLTEEEVKLMKDLAELFIEIRKRDYYVDAVINRLKRGVITPDKAVEELKEIGIEEDLAEAIVEAKAKIYTLSPSTYVSMMEYIPIDRRTFERKMKSIGMPDDEVKRYYAYAVARTLREEFMTEVRAILKEYEEGMITKNDAITLLRKLATLDGKAKQLLGVDWIILDENEIKFLIEAYEIRKKIKEERARRRRSR